MYLISFMPYVLSCLTYLLPYVLSCLTCIVSCCRARVCVCVCVCVFISFHRKGFSWLKQNNKCNARDQASDVVLRKLLCVKYLHRHVIDNHSRDLQTSNCARVSIKPGRDMRSKIQLLRLSKKPTLNARIIPTFLLINLGSRSAAAKRQIYKRTVTTPRGVPYLEKTFLILPCQYWLRSWHYGWWDLLNWQL